MSADSPTLEAACRRILGSMKWQSMEELNPSQHVEAIWMLDEGWPADIVAGAVSILQRYAWFRAAGVTRAPWDLTPEDWEAVTTARPWERGQSIVGQLSLFGEGVA